jgi:hypothetical protein
MAITTPNMKLNVWNSLTDVYDHSQLASNFIAIDSHDHGSNGGAQIDGSVAIKDASIPGSKMASDFSYSFASGSIPASSLATSTDSTGISYSQIKNYAVSLNKVGAAPYCEMHKTTGALSTSYDALMTTYNTITENANFTGETAMVGDSGNSGLMTVRRSGIYMVHAYLEWTAADTSATYPMLSIKQNTTTVIARTAGLGRHGGSTPAYNYAGNVFAIVSATANDSFGMYYRLGTTTTAAIAHAYLKATWISPYSSINTS